MCSSTMSLKVFIFSKEHSAHSKNREQRMRQLVAYGKQLTVTPKKWSQSLTRRWSFTGSSNCKALTGKFLGVWIGGRLREVASHREVHL